MEGNEKEKLKRYNVYFTHAHRVNDFLNMSNIPVKISFAGINLK